VRRARREERAPVTYSSLSSPTMSSTASTTPSSVTTTLSTERLR